MKIQFLKNIQFSKLIKANGRLCEFNFRKMTGLHEGLFSVDVADDRGNRILFKMEKTNDHWKIITPNLPSWINEVSNKLHEQIEYVLEQEKLHEHKADQNS